MSRLCKKCGNEVKMEDQFCMHCGMPLEKEESVREEESKSQNQGAVLSMWDYVLMMILMAIPVVNIVVCILWIISKNGNPNRRNFAKAWLVVGVAGTILAGILSYGLFHFIVMEHYVAPDYQFQYTIPETEFLDNFPIALDEV